MLASLRRQVRSGAERWLFQWRAHEPGQVQLRWRRVFILPTKAGMAFVLVLLTLFAGAVNFNLGLGYALTFFSFACGIVDMLMTATNLAQLRLTAGRTPAVFAGDEARFELQLINRSRRARFAIELDFMEQALPRHATDIAPHTSSSVLLSRTSTERGWLAAPRVRLSSSFPLGLFKAWSYWQPDARVLVYPKPEREAPPLPLTGFGAETGRAQSGADEVSGIRPYQAGDPLRHLAWRQIARFDPALGGQLLSKQFDGGASGALELDFHSLPPHLDLEVRLSRMTRWVLEAERRALPYAFHLGPHYFSAALGATHQNDCLQALALYPTEAR